MGKNVNECQNMVRIQHWQWYNWCYYCQFLPKPIYPNEAIDYKIDIFFNFTWSLALLLSWLNIKHVKCSLFTVHIVLLPIGNHHKDIETMLCKFLNNHHYFCIRLCILGYEICIALKVLNLWLLLCIVCVEPMFVHVLWTQVAFQFEWNLAKKSKTLKTLTNSKKNTTAHCPLNSFDRVTN